MRQSSDRNPTEGFERVYGYGISQTGRKLQHLLYLALNVAEDGSVAYDELIPHVAGGRRGEFNHRFAQSSQQSLPGFGQLFPFGDEPTVDPYSERTEGLLDRLREGEETRRGAEGDLHEQRCEVLAGRWVARPHRSCG